MYENSDVSIIEIIKECFRITKKAKLKVLLFYLSFIGWYILGMLTLGILFIYVTPYISVTSYYLYKKLSGKEYVNSEISSQYMI